MPWLFLCALYAACFLGDKRGVFFCENEEFKALKAQSERKKLLCKMYKLKSAELHTKGLKKHSFFRGQKRMKPR